MSGPFTLAYRPTEIDTVFPSIDDNFGLYLRQLWMNSFKQWM